MAELPEATPDVERAVLIESIRSLRRPTLVTPYAWREALKTVEPMMGSAERLEVEAAAMVELGLGIALEETLRRKLRLMGMRPRDRK